MILVVLSTQHGQSQSSRSGHLVSANLENPHTKVLPLTSALQALNSLISGSRPFDSVFLAIAREEWT